MCVCFHVFSLSQNHYGGGDSYNERQCPSSAHSVQSLAQEIIVPVRLCHSLQEVKLTTLANGRVVDGGGKGLNLTIVLILLIRVDAVCCVCI